jgi:hypothetical protein
MMIREIFNGMKNLLRKVVQNKKLKKERQR